MITDRFVQPCPSVAPPSGWPPSGWPPNGPNIHLASVQPSFVFDPRTNALATGPVIPHFTEDVVALADGRAAVFGQYLAVPGGCAGEQQVVQSWLGVLDLGTNTVLTSVDPLTGAGSLPVEIEKRYRAGALLRDGRLALVVADFEHPAPNEVDLVTIED